MLLSRSSVVARADWLIYFTVQTFSIPLHPPIARGSLVNTLNGEPKEQRDPYKVSEQTAMSASARVLQWCFMITCTVGETKALL